MIRIQEPATNETFDPDCYLWANPDVAEAAAGDITFALRHFETFGLAEGRRQLRRESLAEIGSLRKRKLARLSLDLETHVTEAFGVTLEMLKSQDVRLPVPYERVSSHEYDPQVAGLVDGDQSGLFLDVGAGFRPTYRHNVVYAEISDLVTTDVLCFADDLPFDDGTFDGIVCLSVLEHVPDPLATAAELLRVVKPGSQIIVDWPFLQPLHGYPHHYFNATEQGARDAFERLGASVESLVPPWLHPAFTIRWILDEWQDGLTGRERHEFLALTVGDILEHQAVELLGETWAAALPQSVMAKISAGTRLRIIR